TSVVIDQHDEWQVGRRYLSETSMGELRAVIAAKQQALDASNGYHQESELVDHCDWPNADPIPPTSRGTILAPPLRPPRDSEFRPKDSCSHDCPPHDRIHAKPARTYLISRHTREP